MGFGLGSARENTWSAGAVATAIAAWGVWQTVDFARSDTVDVTLEANDELPPLELFGGRFHEGNIVELTVAKADLGHLQGFVTFCGYARPLALTSILLVGLFFLWRFCIDVITEKPFTNRTNINLIMVGVAVVAYAVVPEILTRLGTNSVIGALDLDAFDSVGSVTGTWIAVGVAVFLQFVFAAMQQGARLAKDNEGLV